MKTKITVRYVDVLVVCLLRSASGRPLPHSRLKCAQPISLLTNILPNTHSIITTTKVT